MHTSIKDLKGVGDKTAQLFEKINVTSVEDLLTYYPREYTNYPEPKKIISLADGEKAAVVVSLISGPATKRVGKLTLTSVKASDDTGTISLTFFNMPFLKNTLKAGQCYVVYGQVKKKREAVSFDHPQLHQLSQYEVLRKTLQPVYPVTKGLTSKMVSKTMEQALLYGKPEYLPGAIKKMYRFMDLAPALKTIHFPNGKEELIEARRRLAFDEFFLFSLYLREMKDENEAIPSSAIMKKSPIIDEFLNKLPYDLTNAQKKVLSEIQNDLSGPYVMNRLIQGDVGSGKTIVAFLALLQCVANGYQGALMAPTEVLAKQHYEGLLSFVEKYDLPFKPVLLTGSLTAKEKRNVYEKIETGYSNVIIGTHALIQDRVTYKNLGLVVTDEQHRFGVRQREALAGKQEDGSVHILVMSATPIPRTLAIVLYGDLHISVIDELPSNRLPIKNCVVDESYHETAYRFIKGQIEAGRQAYVVCPMVEEGEGEMEHLHNVCDYTKALQEKFPDNIRIEMLHGKMKPALKNEIMEAFGRHEIDILVSTTVIEVGINVPNATVMMVENSERFGLAQLHQLRGRVGRGKEQSFCIFVSGNKSEDTMERLKILNKSNDGFYIAEQDMKLRGPGDIFGIRQSGALVFPIGDIFTDADLLKVASETAESLINGEIEVAKEEMEKLHRYMGDYYKNRLDFGSI